MAYVKIEQLLEAGAHFGHLTRRWNPKMRPFIFGERNGIHILDLRKTQMLVDLAVDAAREVAERGQKFLFVGTKKQAKQIMSAEAVRAGSYFVTERWLGGMLTNFATIRKSIRHLESIEKMETDGTFDKLRKKERLTLSREKDKLMRVFGGIRDMSRLPGALFVVDIKKEHLAVKEANKLGIPVFAIVDTNCDPMEVAYPIPANDDSIKTIELISKVVADGIHNGSQTSKIRRADESAGDDREFKEGDGGDEATPQVRRKMRSRGRGQGQGGGGSRQGGGRSRDAAKDGDSDSKGAAAPAKEAPKAEAAPAVEAPKAEAAPAPQAEAATPDTGDSASDKSE